LFPEADSRWSRLISRHLERCPVCREQAEGERRLIRALRGSAPPVKDGLPLSLQRRILAGIKPGQEEAKSAYGIGWRWLRPWAVAAVCVGLTLVLWPRDWRSGTESSPELAATLPEQVGGEATVGPVRVEPGTMLWWAERADEPLRAEFGHAVADGRRLFAAVVQSVVPDGAAAAILARTEGWMVGQP
jgi:hypothetical protein